MFEANSRYVEMCAVVPEAKRVSVSAVAVKPGNSKPKCSLCSFDKSDDVMHRLNDCKKYPDTKSKLEKLKSISGCTKCGLANHNQSRCTYKFNRNCFKCNANHFTFLCDQNVTTASNSNEKSYNKIQNKQKSNKNVSAVVATVSTVNMSVVSYNDVIVPTATGYLGSGSNKECIRILKDTGSQSSFIKGPPHSIPNSKIVGNANLNLIGINSAKILEAPIVNFPIEIEGLGEVSVNAICHDEFSIEATAPGLAGLASSLRSRGVKLADTEIVSDKLDNIKLILGNDNAHILPITQSCFGADGKESSCVYDTPAGVMLVGSVATYNQNIELFPSKPSGQD